MSDPTPQPSASSGSSIRTVHGAAARTRRGPETVINPERRGAVPLPASAQASPTGNSSIVRILFPPEGDDAPPATFDSEQGVELGHFAIIQRIRTGGMGAVFRAIDRRLNRIVALKVLPPLLSRDPLIVQRFRNEAQAAAQLDHENIARVFFVGEEQGLHFIAFEFVSGVNVRDLISQQGRIPVADTVNFGLQIATALVHTSAQGVVHRDIKPSNIIITPGGRAKLVDLGLAKQDRADDEAADLTLAGTTLGTFDYISPEQARDPRTVDVRSDIYSLGCTLYHMLTGEPPYPEGTVLQKLLQHQGDDAPDPAARNPSVPENLSVVIQKMMAKDPRRRYQNADQLVRDLLLVAGALGLRSVSPEGLVWLSARSEKSSFWERHLAWIATVATLLAIVGYLEYGGNRLTPSTSQTNPSAGELAQGGGSPTTASSENPAPGSKNRASQQMRKGAGSTLEDPLPGSVGNIAISSTNDLPSRNHGKAASEDASSGNRSEKGSGDNRIALSPGLLDSASSALRPEGGTGSLGPLDRSIGETVEPSPNTETARTPGRATSPGTSEKTTPAGSPSEATAGRAPASSTEDAVVLLGRDNTPDKWFPSLEAACAEVRQDGAVIELRYDGTRIETGLKIRRRVTIRAARGRRPAIEFRPPQAVIDGYQMRAVSIPSGSLDLIGVDMSLVVDDVIPAEHWSLFSLDRPDALRLQRVTLTLVNPRERPAAIIELKPGSGAMMPDMPAAGMQTRPPLEIDLADSLIRGQGDLFSSRQTETSRLSVRQCVVALQGALLNSRGHIEISQENAQLELRLDHVTAALDGGLLRFDSGMLPRKLIPVQVTAADSIFSTPRGAALVWMSGNSPTQDFRSLLLWNGKNNIYDRFRTFWSISSTEGTGLADVSDFAAWKKTWTESSEANPRQVDGAIWARRQWESRPFDELEAPDFSLDRQQAGNPAVAGATNSTDAGANLDALPRMRAGEQGK